MYTRFDSATKDRKSLSETIVQIPRQSSISLLNIIILVGLTLAALLPRIVLALQLDVVTDEVVYIQAGKIYLPLLELESLKLGASGWQMNYEHPPLVKLLIGLSLSLNNILGRPLGELLAARMPSTIMGTLLVLAIYRLGRAPVGRVTALLAALCLAFSPWLVYFSSLAYLDMTMTGFITIAYLLLWHAPQRPALYPLCALLVGLGAASKYTAVLIIPGMVLFTAYYFFLIRPRLPVEQRPRIPWPWWISATILAPLTFLVADPAIWPSPYELLMHSFRFEWDHSVKGHLTFINGNYSLHVPHWSILYVLLVKISVFVILPAAFFICYSLIKIIQFHLCTSSIQASNIINLSFILIWIITTIGMFSLLNIVVGTHYHLPMAAPLGLAGAYGLAMLLRYRCGHLFSLPASQLADKEALQTRVELPPRKIKPNFREAVVVVLLAIVLAGPHLIGLVSIPRAEGYTSELFQGENTTLQVAYPGYRDALQWLAEHTQGSARVGLGALPDTLGINSQDSSWYYYNRNLGARYHLAEAHPNDKNYSYDYLIWPMHLVQRGFPIPAPRKSYILHTISGGNTTYCYIIASTIPASQRKD